MENLLLITGAGASFDVVDDARVGTNAEFRPPLTRYLFDTKRIGGSLTAGGVHNSFIEGCLKNHKIAACVGYEFQMAKNGAEENLESYLLSLKNHRLQMKRSQYWATIPYFHELFEGVSNKYIRTGGIASNYKLLIDCLAESNYGKILWINLNYDLLADRAISASTHNDLSNLSDYMNLETKDGLKIMYAKPHGSVDWFMMIKDPKITLKTVMENDLPDGFESRIHKVIYTKKNAMKEQANIKGDTRGFPAGWFPAITAPIGEYDFIYEKHIDALKAELRNTTTMLCIGFSGLDKDILDLIKDHMPKVIKKLLVVNGSIKTGEQAYWNMARHCGNSHADIDIIKRVVFDGGFTAFVERGMREWIFRK